MLAKVPCRWLADLDSVVLCSSALLSQVLLVEGAALGAGSVADLGKWSLWSAGAVLWPVDDLTVA